jgi:2-keto-4-pentenoate hydratase/2-oxohepta-3-ene-1,7-dioic acid hydratase in catechol pathway
VTAGFTICNDFSVRESQTRVYASELIYRYTKMIEELTTVCTLEPGVLALLHRFFQTRVMRAKPIRGSRCRSCRA